MRKEFIITAIGIVFLLLLVTSCSKEPEIGGINEPENDYSSEISTEGYDSFLLASDIIVDTPEGYTPNDTYYNEMNAGEPASISFNKNDDPNTYIETLVEESGCARGEEYEDRIANPLKYANAGKTTFGKIKTPVGYMYYKYVTADKTEALMDSTSDEPVEFPELYAIGKVGEDYITVEMHKVHTNSDTGMIVHEKITSEDFETFKGYLETLKLDDLTVDD